MTSHCGGPLGTNEIAVPKISPELIRMDDSTHAAVSGFTRRARIMMLPGLGGSSNAALADITGGPVAPAFYEGVIGNVRSRLNAAGFQTVQVPNIPQFSQIGVQSILNDITSAADGGARYLNKQLLYWDHIVDLCNFLYGPMPTFVVGLSWGAWWGLELAIHRGPGNGIYSIAGAYTHCNVNDFHNVSPFANGLFSTESSAFYGGMTPPVSGVNLSQHALDGVTIPVRATWAWVDVFITNTPNFGDPTDCIAMVSNASVATGGNAASGQTTIASASGGVDVTTLTGTQDVHVADTSSLLTPFSGTGSFFTPTTAGLDFAGFTYNGVTAGAPGVLHDVNNVLPSAQTGLLISGGNVDARVVAGGLVTGQGMAEGHGWDIAGSLGGSPTNFSFDSDDCVDWFTGSQLASYGFAF